MRSIGLWLTFWCIVANALQLPDFQPFLDAISPVLLGDNSTQHDLLKRQSTGCPTGYNNCASLGASGLCCASSAVCSADANDDVACCKSGSVCTGTIAGYITAGTVDASGNLVTASGTTATSATTTTAASTATTTTATTTATTTGNGLILVGSTVVATPGAAMKIEVPVIAGVVVKVLQAVQLW